VVIIKIVQVLCWTAANKTSNLTPAGSDKGAKFRVFLCYLLLIVILQLSPIFFGFFRFRFFFFVCVWLLDWTQGSGGEKWNELDSGEKAIQVGEEVLMSLVDVAIRPMLVEKERWMECQTMVKQVQEGEEALNLIVLFERGFFLAFLLVVHSGVALKLGDYKTESCNSGTHTTFKIVLVWKFPCTFSTFHFSCSIMYSSNKTFEIIFSWKNF